jgi:hypothetical protein
VSYLNRLLIDNFGSATSKFRRWSAKLVKIVLSRKRFVDRQVIRFFHFAPKTQTQTFAMQSDDAMNKRDLSGRACHLSEKIASPNRELPLLPQNAIETDTLVGDKKGKHNRQETSIPSNDSPPIDSLLLAEIVENPMDRRSLDEVKPIIGQMEMLRIVGDASYSTLLEMVTASLGSIRNLSNDKEYTDEEGFEECDDREDELRDSIHVTKQRWQSKREQSTESQNLPALPRLGAPDEENPNT